MIQNVVKCGICGKQFTVKTIRNWRARKYCSLECRTVVHREVMAEYQRKRRAQLYKFIYAIHTEAHFNKLESGDVGIDFTYEQYINNPRVDDTHDSWDFIPGLDYCKMGTLIGTDLSIVKDESGQERINGILQLEKAKRR